MKLDKQTIGKRYARALFEYASEQDQTKDIFTELMTLRRVLADNPQLLLVLTNAHLRAKQRQELLDVLKPSFSVTMQNFLQMIYDYERVEDLELIIDDYEQFYDQATGRVLIKAITPAPMPDRQKDALADAYLQKFGGNSAVVTNVLDPSLIGGIILEAQGRRIDGSVVTKLQAIRKILAQPLNEI